MRLLYLEGDRCSLKYLLGAFHAAAIDATNPDEPPPTWSGHDCVLLSDFTAQRLGEEGARTLAHEVARGLGLIMVGGWTSFGRGGYARSPLAAALPVTLIDGDDRKALVRGAYPEKHLDHACLADVDWTRPPILCGYNSFVAKPNTNVILTLDDSPLLVAGTHDAGRVIAYAGDLAPHWSGGMTDWGSGTVPGPEGEEMGTDYVAFIAGMVKWAARTSKSARLERA